MNIFFWRKTYPPNLKISFRIPKTDGDFPPFDYEGIWGDHVGRGVYRLVNIPLWVPELSKGDEVRPACIGGEYYFHKRISNSEVSTIWIAVNIQDGDAGLRQAKESIHATGCEFESCKVGQLIVFGISVPPSIELEKIIKSFASHLSDGLVELVIGSDRHSTRKLSGERA